MSVDHLPSMSSFPEPVDDGLLAPAHVHTVCVSVVISFMFPFRSCVHQGQVSNNTVYLSQLLNDHFEYITIIMEG